MDLVSILCIENNKEVYKDFLDNLRTQVNVSYELINISNENGEYESACEAYNKAVKHARGKYCIFCHQDIRFEEPDSLYNILVQIKAIGEFGVAGIAGAREKGESKYKTEIVGTIKHGRNKELICGKKIISPEPVQTVDECFFVIESSIFAKYQFPQKDGWHLYAVEYCLKMLKCGYSNYAIPAKIWHMSDGVKGLNTAYVKRIKEIIKENKREFGVIYTTIKPWPTGGIRLFVMIYVNYFKWGLKEVLRR